MFVEMPWIMPSMEEVTSAPVLREARRAASKSAGILFGSISWAITNEAFCIRCESSTNPSTAFFMEARRRSALTLAESDIARKDSSAFSAAPPLEMYSSALLTARPTATAAAENATQWA